MAQQMPKSSAFSRQFRDKGLLRFWENDDETGIPQVNTKRLSRQLDRLMRAASPQEMGVPGWVLERLHGDMQGYWSVRITGNWRLIFRFERGQAVGIEVIDYHRRGRRRR